MNQRTKRRGLRRKQGAWPTTLDQLEAFLRNNEGRVINGYVIERTGEKRDDQDVWVVKKAP